MQVAPGEHYGDAASSGEKRPTGKVVGIIRRNWRTRGYAGSLMPDQPGRGARRGGANMLFCPIERKFPFIRIHTRQVMATFLPFLAACSVFYEESAQRLYSYFSSPYFTDIKTRLPEQGNKEWKKKAL